MAVIHERYNTSGNASSFSPFWWHLLAALLLNCCLLIYCQQSPYKYQQLQYKMLQQQQQQYEFQKQLQQLYIQKQLKQQQQKPKLMQTILPLSIPLQQQQQRQLLLQQQQLKLQRQLEQQQQLEKEQQLEELLQRQKLEEQLKKQKQMQKQMQQLQQLKIKQQQDLQQQQGQQQIKSNEQHFLQEKYTTMSIALLPYLHQQKIVEQNQQPHHQQQQHLEHQSYELERQRQQQQLALQQEQLLLQQEQQYSTLPISFIQQGELQKPVQHRPQQQSLQSSPPLSLLLSPHQSTDAGSQNYHEDFYPIFTSALPTQSQITHTSSSLIENDCDSPDVEGDQQQQQHQDQQQREQQQKSQQQERQQENEQQSQQQQIRQQQQHEQQLQQHDYAINKINFNEHQLTRATTEFSPQSKHRQPQPGVDIAGTIGDNHNKNNINTGVKNDVVSNLESINYWRGLISEFVPTAAAVRGINPTGSTRKPITKTTAATAPTPATTTTITTTTTTALPTTTTTRKPIAVPLMINISASVTTRPEYTQTPKRSSKTLTSDATTTTVPRISSTIFAAPTRTPTTTTSTARPTFELHTTIITTTHLPPAEIASNTAAKSHKGRLSKTGKRRRKQPTVREPLAALEKEQKLYELRDKLRQESAAEVTSAYRDKSYRRPYSQAKREHGSAESLDVIGRGNTTTRKSADLKNILKNSGGLSLSEILQQKNLSLDDLLKGKQTALLALQTTAATMSQQKPEINGRSPPKPKRRLPSLTTTTTTAAAAITSSEEIVSSSRETGDENTNKKRGRNKNNKLPALQRLKLFGSAIRYGGMASSNGNSSTNRRKESVTIRSTNITAKTAKTTTSPMPLSKRLPVYRKRQPLLQRSTLKPLGALRNAATISATKSASTTTQTTTTNAWRSMPVEVKPSLMDFKQSGYPEEEATIEEETDDDTADADGIDDNDGDDDSDKENDNGSDATTEMAIRGMSKSTKTTFALASNESSSSVISKIQSRYDKNPKTNIIELEDQPTHKRTDITDAEIPVTYAADDDLEDFFDESTTTKDTTSKNDTSTPIYNISGGHVSVRPRHDHQSPRPSSATRDFESLSTYVDPVDDRTDLLELIEDRNSGNRLFKVLEQRNMTLEELIEHRKRGASKLHLAMVVQNRSRFFPDNKVILRDDMDIVTAFENFPHFNLMNLKSVKPDEIKTDSQGSSYFTSIIDIEPTDEIYRNNDKNLDSSGSDNNGIQKGFTLAQSQRSEKSLTDIFPPWKTIGLAPLAHTAQDPSPHQQPFFIPQSKLLLDTTASIGTRISGGGGRSSDSGIGSSEELPEAPDLLLSNEANLSIAPIEAVEVIENEVARAHDLLGLELSGHGFKRSPMTAGSATVFNANQQQMNKNGIYGNMPAGIRSAIVASAAIVLTSASTFIIIFILCRWKQQG